MSARFFQPGRTPSGTVPSTTALPWKTSEVIVIGSVLTIDSNGLLVVASADPTSVVGVAMQAIDTGAGWAPADNPTVITGRESLISVAMADRQNLFTGRMVNGGTDPVTPTQAMVGDKFGIVKSADETWAIDQADTSNLVVQIEKVDIPRKVLYFRFLEAVIQFA
jgi:hypothetical protein